MFTRLSLPPCSCLEPSPARRMTNDGRRYDACPGAER